MSAVDTIVQPAGAAVAPKTRGRYFYVTVSSGVAVLVVLAFTRTYWAPMAQGSLDLHPAVHVHAALFFVWTLFYVLQTALAAGGRTALHREIGLFGIALAAMMVFAGILAQIVTLEPGLAGPRPEAARRAAVLSFAGMTMFTTFIALAIASIKKPERHKRFMVLATFAILQAAVARVIMLFPAITQPQRMTAGAVIVDLLVVGAAFYDRRLHGRWHPVYLLGLAYIVFIQIARAAIVETQAWLDFTMWLAALTR